VGSSPAAPAKPFCFLKIKIIEVICIHQSRVLDWYRFHGKKVITQHLQEQGFYDIKIRRKID